ncbi:Eukaryotic translation initiation factor 3 subunit C [Meloidogyne graminicola]|uniref:Eukaryotic translation initiation factor 3 subunit C n=1 Tax=Meloidogyne graminicola TaxID=189291 RepID=A0A8S9ZKW9_9BILA|nr:Eukaryotic translation initiation factor 3 subunit C [Meloidogyne graminicola]
MSKFFRSAVSSSSGSESGESDVEAPVAQTRPLGRQDFAYPSDSEDEGPKRIVRSQKDKTYGELKEMIRNSRNARNIKDVSKLLAIFEEHIKYWEKAKLIIARENSCIPRFYIRYLAELDDFVNEQWDDREGRKIMSKQNAKALATFRQKIKKYNKEFEDHLIPYREEPDPVGYSSGAVESNDEDELEDGEEVLKAIPATTLPPATKARLPKPVPTKKKTAKVVSGSEEEETDWGTESDESSASDLEPLEGKEMEELRRYFLKKDKTVTKAKDKEERKAALRLKEEKRRAIIDEGEDNQKENEQQHAWEKVTYNKDAIKPLFDSKEEITGELIIKKLSELNTNRGRKSTNRKIYVRYLKELYKATDENGLGVGLLAKILTVVIAALFEMNTRISDAMEFNSWTKTVETVNGLLNLLNEHPNVIISISTGEDEENLLDKTKNFTIHGSVILMVKRLDDELTKIFQSTDCHSTDYIEKLKGESSFCSLIEKAQLYADSRQKTAVFDQNEILTIYGLRIEHLYYKYSIDEAESEKLMESLCKVIYSIKNAPLARQRAMLSQIYHHALHDRWHKARNLMLMSHLQAIVDHSDANTQVLYNRTICQLGLCAFRHGLIKEAHQNLSEIQNTQRSKELLAQGIPPRQSEKTAEQELKERSLQVPYHMHINLELMECVYLICSMLLEIPNIACYEYDVRRRLLSRSFHYQLKFSEKAALIGPPENTREHVVAASRAMLRGDWMKCRDYIINDKMNAKVWNLFRNSENVKKVLVQRIQEDTMRTYLLMYSTIYSTVLLNTLCEQFQLSRQRIYAIISKMIIQEELSAKFDESTDCLIMHKVEPSKLQLLSLQAAEKFCQISSIEQTGGGGGSGGISGGGGGGGVGGVGGTSLAHRHMFKGHTQELKRAYTGPEKNKTKFIE